MKLARSICAALVLACSLVLSGASAAWADPCTEATTLTVSEWASCEALASSRSTDDHVTLGLGLVVFSVTALVYGTLGRRGS